ncbi:hypothetical protein NESM_000668800 [Novymonas esmeraldas]|uniref:IQ calmodulin-binding motif family protein n=1 Tax=Novymonas esmeraldas TaxID=1808958 RepID=A0AAW0EU43_9TRYP
MHKPRSASVSALPSVMAPHPPSAGAPTAPRRRTYNGDLRSSSSSSRPRQVSLAAPRHVPKYVFTAPAPIPWPRTLRGARDVFAATVSYNRPRQPSKAGEGALLQPVRPQSVASAADPARHPAAHRVSFAADKVGGDSDEDAALFGDTFDGGLSCSSLAGWSARGSRRPSSHLGRSMKLQLDAAAIEDELGWSTNSRSLSVGGAAANALQAKFAAFDTLRLLLVPIWKLYRFHKQMVRATATVAKYVLRKVHRRRQRRNERAADAILCVLQNPRTRLRCAAHLLGARAALIQRAFRRHRQRVQAVVELNYRKMRRDAEEAYWAAVVAQRKAELAEQPLTSTAVARAVREVVEATAEVRTRFGTIHRRSTLLHDAATAAAEAARNYELDVYNFYMIGRLPESLLRFETASAVFAHLRRSAVRAHLMDDFSATRARRAAMEGFLEPDDLATPIHAPPTRRGGKSRAMLPHFLPESVYSVILDNTCYVTSIIRDDKMLRAHLRQRAHPLEAY